MKIIINFIYIIIMHFYFKLAKNSLKNVSKSRLLKLIAII